MWDVCLRRLGIVRTTRAKRRYGVSLSGIPVDERKLSSYLSLFRETGNGYVTREVWGVEEVWYLLKGVCATVVRVGGGGLGVLEEF